VLGAPAGRQDVQRAGRQIVTELALICVNRGDDRIVVQRRPDSLSPRLQASTDIPESI
jgi:hypothetical protein